MTQDPIVLLYDRLHRVERWFSTDLPQALDTETTSLLAQWRARLNQIELAAEAFPLRPIALIGPTGAGKSALLNALLGQNVLAVSSIKACTAVLTTVRYSPDPIFRADIRFLDEDEWKAEVQASSAVLEAMTDGDDRSPEWRTLERAARDRLHSVFGLGGVDPSERVDLGALTLPARIASYMRPGAGPLHIEDPEPAHFRSKLRAYTSADGRYWPLVKSVEIAGPFEVLRGGVAFVDLPGINDPNEAREEITRRHLRDASAIWVLFNTKRGLTNDIREVLLEQRLLRQLLLAGQTDAVTLVGTHADDFDPAQAADEFGLDWQTAPIDILRERNKRVVKQARTALEEIATEFFRDGERARESFRQVKRTLTRTRIFTVSTTAYARLAGQTGASKDYGIEDPDDTGVPDLLRHVESVGGEGNLESHGRQIEQKLDLLLDEIDVWLRGRRSALENRRADLRQQVTRLRERLRDPRKELDADILDILQSAEDRFRERHEVFTEQIVEASRRAHTELDALSSHWSSINFHTLKAALARGGKFTSPSSGKRTDLSSDIAEPLLDAVAFAWDDYFGHYLSSVLGDVRAQLQKSSEVFLIRIKTEAQASGNFDDETLKGLRKNVGVARRALWQIADDVEQSMRETMTRVRRSLTDVVADTIASAMKSVYLAASKRAASESKSEVLDGLQKQARRKAGTLFPSIERELLDGVAALGRQFDEDVRRLSDEVIEQAHRVMQNLSGSEPSEEKEVVDRRLKSVATALQKLSKLVDPDRDADGREPSAETP